MKKIVSILISSLFLLTAISMSMAEPPKPNEDITLEEVMKIVLKDSFEPHLKFQKFDDVTEETNNGEKKNKNIVEYFPGIVCVGLKQDLPIEYVKNLKNFFGYEIIGKCEGLNLLWIKVKENHEAKVIYNLIQRGNVEFAEPNYMFHTLGERIPNDEYYDEQWGLPKIKCPIQWNQNTGDSNTVIAILDTGVDYTHKDLRDNIWHDWKGRPGKDFVDLSWWDKWVYDKLGYVFLENEDYDNIDYKPMDVEGHGTACAGVAGAVGNNNEGISGVCWNINIMPVRVGFALKKDGIIVGRFDSDAIANGIYYAANHGANVISMSFGTIYYEYPLAVKRACNYAYYMKNVVLVAAAGNEEKNEICKPAKFNSVIAVGAIDQFDNSYKPEFRT